MRATDQPKGAALRRLAVAISYMRGQRIEYVSDRRARRTRSSPEDPFRGALRGAECRQRGLAVASDSQRQPVSSLFRGSTAVTGTAWQSMVRRSSTVRFRKGLRKVAGQIAVLSGASRISRSSDRHLGGGGHSVACIDPLWQGNQARRSEPLNSLGDRCRIRARLSSAVRAQGGRVRVEAADSVGRQ